MCQFSTKMNNPIVALGVGACFRMWGHTIKGLVTPPLTHSHVAHAADEMMNVGMHFGLWWEFWFTFVDL